MGMIGDGTHKPDISILITTIFFLELMKIQNFIRTYQRKQACNKRIKNRGVMQNDKKIYKLPKKRTSIVEKLHSFL